MANMPSKQTLLLGLACTALALRAPATPEAVLDALDAVQAALLAGATATATATATAIASASASATSPP